jgi:hypothetical protein
MKHQSRLFKIGLLFSVALLLAGWGRDPIKTVKSGTLAFDTSVTVGGALDGYRYFKETKWETFEDEQGRTVVQFTGAIKLDAFEGVVDEAAGLTISKAMVEKAKSAEFGFQMDYVCQFVISKVDDKSFDIRYSGCNVRFLGMKEGGEPSPGAVSPDQEEKDEDLSFLKAIYANKPAPAVEANILLSGMRSAPQ